MIEKEPIHFEPFKIEIKHDQYELLILSSQTRMNISANESQYLQFLVSGTTIESLVQHFIGQGWLVNFVELYELLQFLTDKKIIRNPSFTNYFLSRQPTESAGLLSKVFSLFREEEVQAKMSAAELKTFPFFRTLHPDVVEIFAQHNKVVKVPENFLICKTGDERRDLFLLVSGTADIYKQISARQHQCIATLAPGSVFGEGGFLMQALRSADVITRESCKLVRFLYHSEVYDAVIRSEHGRTLQKRFWLLNAFQKSEVFKNMPTESFDKLLFKGEFKTCKANEVLFHEDEIGVSFFIIVQGRMAFYQKNRRINELSQGDSFGEMALFVSKNKRTATVVAETDSLLLEITQKEVYDVLGENLFLAKEMQTQAFARLRSDELRFKRRA